MSRLRPPRDPSEALLWRTRIRLSAITLLMVATLVIIVGATSAAVATELMRESVDRALDAAVSDPLTLHELLEDERESPFSGTLGRADTFVMLVDTEGNIYGSTTAALLPGVPDVAAIVAAASADDRRTGTYGDTRLRLLTARFATAELEDDDDEDLPSTALYLQAGHDLSLQRELEQQLLLAIALIGLVGLAGAVLVTLFVTRRALSPIREAFDTERRFVASASHELRTPVAIIRASAEILQRERLIAPTGQPLVEDIVGESDRMGRLVGDLMALASAHTGAIAMDMQPLGLGAYFDDIMRRSTSIAEARGLRLAAAASGPVSDAAVMADRDRLDQLLLILVDNALRHSPAAGTVRVELVVDRAGRTATLSVSDDGPGVGLDEVERIFEPFERSAVARGQGDGAGLGLAIARQLAERQNAELGVESQPGTGATFRLRMKLLDETQAH